MDWQGFASQLVALLLPEKTWEPGEFEATDKDALLADCRIAAMTDARVELAQQALETNAAKRQALIDKMTAEDRSVLGL